jgi:hypothetical protein
MDAPLRPRDGVIAVPSGPGLGIALDMEVIEAHRVEFLGGDMSDELEIKALIERGAILTDSKRFDELLECFAPDATFMRRGKPLVGHAAIAEENRKRPVDLVTRHHVTSVLVTMTGPDTAEAISYVLVYRIRGEAGAPPAFPQKMRPPETSGEYHDRFIRTPKGWKIAYRETRDVLDG